MFGIFGFPWWLCSFHTLCLHQRLWERVGFSTATPQKNTSNVISIAKTGTRFNVSTNKVINSYSQRPVTAGGESCGCVVDVESGWEPEKHICAAGSRGKHVEWQRCGGQRKETSNGRDREREVGCCRCPLRGQVWTTIKTEFHWQPSGNSPNITRKGRDICKNPHVRPHTQTYIVIHICKEGSVYTHSSIFMSFMRTLLGQNKKTMQWCCSGMLS